jgi:AraC-like DNA-binding protein
MPDKSDVFSASNYYISQFYYLAKRCDLDADALFAQADIDPAIVDCSGVRVPAEKLSTLVETIWDVLDDEAMSLGASRLPRGAFSMMGSLTVHEPNLESVIEQACRFYAMVTEAYTVELDQSGAFVEPDRVLLKCVLKDPSLDSRHLLSEITLMGWHRYFSWLIAENLMLDKVYFHYQAPAHLEEYMYLFPGQHLFEQSFLGFSFPKHFLEKKNVRNTDSLKVFMQNCPAQLFLQPRTDFSLTGVVSLILKRNLKSGFPTIEETAEELHLTKRTLIRRLMEEGSAYQKLKDSIRRDRAAYLLSKGSLSITEVAEHVGFSDSAVFARAFKSWTGFPPSAYQKVKGPGPTNQ